MSSSERSSGQAGIDPELLAFIVQKIQEYFGSDGFVQVILFGSRARGDNGKRSDFDLAFILPRDRAKNWASFVSDLDEDAPTLKKMDLINLEDCQVDLKDRILSEGKIVYEQNCGK